MMYTQNMYEMCMCVLSGHHRPNTHTALLQHSACFPLLLFGDLHFFFIVPYIMSHFAIRSAGVYWEDSKMEICMYCKLLRVYVCKYLWVYLWSSLSVLNIPTAFLHLQTPHPFVFQQLFFLLFLLFFCQIKGGGRHTQITTVETFSIPCESLALNILLK